VTSAELRRRLSAARDGLLGRIPTDSIGRFRRDGWNRLLLKDLQLNSDSVAFDVGGYRGDYTASLLELYGCRVHVFEPVGMFADHLDRRFGRDSRVMVHRAALGARAGTFQLTFERTRRRRVAWEVMDPSGSNGPCRRRLSYQRK